MAKICVTGTTSWGITLAIVMARRNHRTFLLTRNDDESERIRHKGIDSKQLPGITLPPEIEVTASAKTAMRHSTAVIIAVPSSTMRANIRNLAPFLTPNRLIISASKGLELGSNKRMSQVIEDEIDPKFHGNICALSGPNLALEIARGMPATAVIANAEESIVERAQRMLKAPGFNVYTNHDIIGVELGGTLKNIIALGAGIIEGLGYGDNAKAAFITRGLTEMSAFAMTMGANPLTLSGLSGLGDVIATCSSNLSRNHHVGMELSKGRPLDEITAGMSGIAEGITTTAAVWDEAQQLKLEMPVTRGLYQVLYKGADPRTVIPDMLGSNPKHELAGRKWKFSSFFKLARWRK